MTMSAVVGTRRRRKYSLVLSLCVLWLGFLLIASLVGSYYVGSDYQAMDLRARLTPPLWLEGGALTHPLGTDNLGRDVLSRLLVSIRISLLVAVAGTLLGAIVGTGIGLAAAKFRGWVDDAVMVAIDFQAAIPFMILALAVIAFFSNSFIFFILLMGLYGWERYARIVRGLALSAIGQGYVVAVQSLGASTARIYLRHVLPNIANAIVVNMTLNFPQTIMLETSLSFLGLGIQPPMTSLGNMVGFGRDYLLTAWWLATLPAIVIFLTTLSFALLGDWVRDKLDPT